MNVTFGLTVASRHNVAFWKTLTFGPKVLHDTMKLELGTFAFTLA